VTVGKHLARVNRKKIVFNLVTNGTLLNDEQISFLTKKDFHVVLSCDGNKMTQDYQRRFQSGDSCFNIVETNLHKLIKSIPNLTVRMTVTPFCVDELFNNVKFLFMKGVDRLGFVPTYENEWSEGDLSKFKKNIRKILKMWQDNIKKRPHFYIMPLINYIRKYHDNDFPFHPYMHPCRSGCGLSYSTSVEGDILPMSSFYFT